MLNLNVPRGATTQTQLRVTSQSRSAYHEHLHPGRRDLAEPVQLKVQLITDPEPAEPGSDVEALVKDQVVSVTPLTWSMGAMIEWSL